MQYSHLGSRQKEREVCFNNIGNSFFFTINSYYSRVSNLLFDIYVSFCCDPCYPENLRWLGIIANDTNSCEILIPSKYRLIVQIESYFWFEIVKGLGFLIRGRLAYDCFLSLWCVVGTMRNSKVRISISVCISSLQKNLSWSNIQVGNTHELNNKCSRIRAVFGDAINLHSLA